MNDRTTYEDAYGEPHTQPDGSTGLRYNSRRHEADEKERGDARVRTVAEFQIQYRQILDPNGRLHGDALPKFATRQPSSDPGLRSVGRG